jgi:hypothetical protein
MEEWHSIRSGNINSIRRSRTTERNMAKWYVGKMVMITDNFIIYKNNK